MFFQWYFRKHFTGDTSDIIPSSKKKRIYRNLVEYTERVPEKEAYSPHEEIVQERIVVPVLNESNFSPLKKLIYNQQDILSLKRDLENLEKALSFEYQNQKELMEVRLKQLYEEEEILILLLIQDS